MNIDYELYRIFYVVAKCENITKASEELCISQPAISKAIKNLEEQLGGQLFTRTKRGVILTEEGKEFFTYIKQAIEFINNGENKFTDLINLETGRIRIGIGTTLTRMFLIPYLEKFHSLYPKIEIETVTDRTSNLITKLKNGLLDIVVLNINDNSYENDIEITKCRKVNDCFVVGKAYYDLVNKELSLKDLNNYPLIFQSKGSNTREFINKIAKDYGIVLTPNIEVASFSLVVDFTKIGFGIGYVTKEYIKDELKNKDLFLLNVKEKIPTRYIGIAISKNHIPNFSTKKLFEIINKKADN